MKRTSRMICAALAACAALAPAFAAAEVPWHSLSKSKGTTQAERRSEPAGAEAKPAFNPVQDPQLHDAAVMFGQAMQTRQEDRDGGRFYPQALSAAKALTEVMHTLPAGCVQWNSCKDMLRQLSTDLEAGAFHYSSKGDSGKAGEFARALVDLKLDKAFEGERLPCDPAVYPSLAFNSACDAYGKGEYIRAMDYFKEYLSTGEAAHRETASAYMDQAAIKAGLKEAPASAPAAAAAKPADKPAAAAKTTAASKGAAPAKAAAAASAAPPEPEIADESAAPAAVSAGPTYALIIANEKYKYIPAAQFASSDGSLFKECCINTMGIPEENILYSENTTLGNLKRSVGRLYSMVECSPEPPRILVYYAGHGFSDADTQEPYLLPTDCDLFDIAGTAYPLSEFYSRLGDMGADNVTVFVDAGFSGSKRDGQLMLEQQGAAVDARGAEPRGNMFVLSASTGRETAQALPEESHGLFTYFLLHKMKESGGDATLGELSDYVISSVKAHPVASGPQTPAVALSGSMNEDWTNLKIKR